MKRHAFWGQFNEKPSIIPGCPHLGSPGVVNTHARLLLCLQHCRSDREEEVLPLLCSCIQVLHHSTALQQPVSVVRACELSKTDNTGTLEVTHMSSATAIYLLPVYTLASASF